MRFKRPASMFALALLCLIFSGCGAKTPAETLSAADKAFTLDSDYPKAIGLYQEVVDWTGEGVVAEGDRVKAYLNLTRCMVANKDFDGAVASLKKMQAALGDSFKPNYINTVISDLTDQNAIDQAIACLGFAGEIYPENKEELKKAAEAIKKRGLSDDQMKKFAELGYL
jgi:tetratricopeptide (TPR) repeat protein